MNDRITLDMTPAEAILAQGALSKASGAAFGEWRQLILTNAPADEQEAAKVSAAILARVDARLANILYPVCEWLTDPAGGARRALLRVPCGAAPGDGCGAGVNGNGSYFPCRRCGALNAVIRTRCIRCGARV